MLVKRVIKPGEFFLMPTASNKFNLEQMFGKSEIMALMNDAAYLRVDLSDINKPKWMPSFVFEWLYHEQPVCSTIENIQSYIKNKQQENVS